MSKVTHENCFCFMDNLAEDLDITEEQVMIYEEVIMSNSFFFLLIFFLLC